MVSRTLNLSSVFRFILITLLILSAARSVYIIYFYERIASLSDAVYMLMQGIRVDLVIAGYFYLIPLLIVIWIKKGPLSRFTGSLVAVWLLISLTSIVFMEVATPEFIHEYDVRPNRIFLDYLIYPKEVFSMLWEGYKPAIFIGLLAVFLCIFGGIRLLKSTASTQRSLSLPAKVGLTVVFTLVGFMVVRSSIQHRPFNPSMVFFSHDNLVNSLMLNSSYSVLYAMYNTRSEQSAFELYGKLDEKTIINYVQKSASIAPIESLDMEYPNTRVPTQRFHEASYKGKPKNIVILLQESLGARHVGKLSGGHLTPNLDSLMDEGWLFTNAYATGTRSVRGIEAVFTGFSPGPSRSVVKLSKSQTGFFSIASLLKRHDYQTQFIYGGESHFDNMKSFFLGNGVDDIHDLSSFNAPQFIGSWGASDEDLYREAHQEFERMHNEGKPFFSLVFTTSNHTPFDFPDTCLPSIEGEKQTMQNAIRYSDCALGRYIATAKQSNYWDDTIFLVIADHDSRAIGADLVPFDYFRIPALILGAGVVPKKDNRLVSQLDFPTTLLSLAGVSDTHPMIGYDLTQTIPIEKQRAMLQYNENFAWLTNDKIVIFQPNVQAKVFKHNGKKLLSEIHETMDDELIQTSLANALWSSFAYIKNVYRDEPRKI